jgi:hypothetical protein
MRSGAENSVVRGTGRASGKASVSKTIVTSIVKSSVGIFASLMASHALAFIAPQEAPAGIKVKSTVVRPGLYQPAMTGFDSDNTTVQLDRQSNSVRQMRGQNLLGLEVRDFTKTGFERAARGIIAARPDIFAVDPADVQINEKATLVDAEDQSVSFYVYRNGIRIQDAGITLRFKQGSLVSLKSETFGEAVITLGETSSTGDIAAKALNSHGYISRGSLWRVKPTAAGYSLVKVDEYVVAGADAAWIVQVDTTDGSLYEVRSKNLNMRGRAVATVYPRYFGEQAQDTPLSFATVTGSSAKADERGEFQSSSDVDAPKMDGLAGQYVTVHNESGANLKATAVKTDGSWNLKFSIKPSSVLWDNNDMAQAMVYVNTNKVINTAKKYIQPTWFNQPLKANVNHSEHCNAFWDGDSINFFTAGEISGKKCANTGMIADVVFHEWGHGLDENTGGIDDGAMSEGFGDAVALLFTDDARVGVDFLPVEHKPVRDMSILKKFPEDVRDEVHADGLIVGGAWYDMYTALKKKHGAAKARDLYAKFLFKGIYSAAKMSDVYEATLALDTGVSTGSQSPNFCLINAAFARHGLATADSSCNRLH